MSRGEAVPFDSYHFRTAPRFETAEPSLKWLERATFVGVAARSDPEARTCSKHH